MSDDRGPNVSALLIAFLAGAAAGAAVALLTTKKTGPEMRESIKTWAKTVPGRETIERAARSVREKFDPSVES